MRSYRPQASRKRGHRVLRGGGNLVHEETAREAQFADEDYVDIERYGLLVDEWSVPGAVLDLEEVRTRVLDGDEGYP